jgi:hypothetical protein
MIAFATRRISLASRPHRLLGGDKLSYVAFAMMLAAILALPAPTASASRLTQNQSQSEEESSPSESGEAKLSERFATASARRRKLDAIRLSSTAIQPRRSAAMNLISLAGAVPAELAARNGTGSPLRC